MVVGYGGKKGIESCFGVEMNCWYISFDVKCSVK